MSGERAHAWNYLVLAFAWRFGVAALGVVLAWLVALAPSRAHASEATDSLEAPSAVAPLGLHAEDTLWDLGDHAEYVVDASETWTLQDARASHAWQPVGAPRKTVRLRGGVLWLRATFVAPADRPESEWRVNFAHPRPVELTMHVDRRDGSPATWQGGLVVPIEERAIVSRNVVVPLKLGGGGPTTVYFRMRTAPLGFSATVGTAEASVKREAREDRVFGLYYGIALGLGLYNLFLLVVLRDRTYAWYLMTIVTTVPFFLSRNGYLFEWGWHANSNLGGGALVAVQLIGMLNFTRSLLGTQRALPRTDRSLGFAVAVLTVTCVASLLLPTALNEARLAALGPPVVVASVAVGLARLRQGSVLARYYTAAWGAFLSGAFLYVFKSTGWMPHNAFTEHAMQVGSAIEMVLLSLALAHRIRTTELDARTREHAAALERLDHARTLDRLRAETATRIVEAQDEHSRALARDLHDSVGHRFVLIDRAVADATEQRDPEALEAIASLAREGLAETREIAHGLYPQRLVDLGLEGALDAALDALSRAGLEVESAIDPPAARALPAARRLAALRIAEEALQNVLRHADARTVKVRLAAGPDSGVVLTVEDDGRGIAPERSEGLGTRTMRDRATQAGGSLTITRRDVAGTVVTLRLPTADASSEPANG
jgi:signal transduction histidine kinase